jgi:hypothetical protein
MNRFSAALLFVCLIGASAAAYRSFSREPEHPPAPQPAAPAPVAVPDPVPVASPAPENPAFALVGQPKSAVYAKMGAPRSQMEGNGIQVLRYETYIFRIKDGVVQSVDVALKETRSPAQPAIQAQAQVAPARPVQQVTQNVIVQTAAPININANRFRSQVEDRIYRWARTMSMNSGEWYRPRSIELSDFDPVSGWTNRYHATGVCEVYNYPHGWRAQNIEVYMELNEQGGFKDADISTRN